MWSKWTPKDQKPNENKPKCIIFKTVQGIWVMIFGCLKLAVPKNPSLVPHHLRGFPVGGVSPFCCPYLYPDFPWCQSHIPIYSETQLGREKLGASIAVWSMCIIAVLQTGKIYLKQTWDKSVAEMDGFRILKKQVQIVWCINIIQFKIKVYANITLLVFALSCYIWSIKPPKLQIIIKSLELNVHLRCTLFIGQVV